MRGWCALETFATTSQECDMADNKIRLLVVVNTEDVTVEANLHAPLQTVAQHALNNSESKDRPLSDFDFKSSTGTPLDLAKKVEEYHFASGTKLFLSLKVGIQGSQAALSRDYGAR
jgi:hypothetical protein